LLLCQLHLIEEDIEALILLDYVEHVQRLVFPCLEVLRKGVAHRALPRRHPHGLPDAMLGHLAEVALPLAPGELPLITEAVCVESRWAVVTADQLARVATDAADVYTAI